jgi:hypothetical protein
MINPEQNPVVEKMLLKELNVDADQLVLLVKIINVEQVKEVNQKEEKPEHLNWNKTKGYMVGSNGEDKMSWFDIIKRLPAFARRDKHSEEQYYSPDKHYAKERYNPTDTKTAQPPTTYRSLVGGEYRDVERQPRVRMATSTEYRDVTKPGGRGERADYRPDSAPSYQERDARNQEMFNDYARINSGAPRMKDAIIQILQTPEYSLKIRRYQDGDDISNVPFPTFEEVKNKMQLSGFNLDKTTRFMREYDNLKYYWGRYFK